MHSSTYGKYVAWCCNTHLADKTKCSMLFLKDEDLKVAFVTVLNKLIYSHKLVLKPYAAALQSNSSDENLVRIQHLERLLEQNTEQRETLTRLMAQGYIDQVLYTEYIKKNPEWEFAGIYADDGISGTNTKNREEFNRMIEDCEAGTIDMIITKSISRFARNTLDCLKYIRQLKEKNIPVFFEKEAINTMDAKGEVLLTIMASLAQQESQSLYEPKNKSFVCRTIIET